MSWLSFLKSKDFDPAEFEKELASITKKISINERNIVKFKYQKRKLVNFVIFYGIIAWLVNSAYIVYQKPVLHLSLKDYLMVVGILVFVYLVRSFIRRIYELRITKAGQSIEQLQSLHAFKIDELKEKTKYSSTQALLSRFGQGTDAINEIDEEIKAKQLELEALNLTKSENEKKSNKWYDSVLNGIVGDDLGPNSRYALICENCQIHNGLAPPGKLPEDVKYSCARCGFMNRGKSKPTMKTTDSMISKEDRSDLDELDQLEAKKDI